MKAVLISIRPEWTRLIVSGQKTIEIRKNRPKLETPFKSYIYQTLPKYGDWNDRDGRVIGEFVCDKIFDVLISCSDPNIEGYPLPGTGLTDRKIMDYLGNGITGYGWHISELKIYDNSKKISDFCKPCPNNRICIFCDYYYSETTDNDGRCIDPGCCSFFERDESKINRPPQSWMYVEERT